MKDESFTRRFVHCKKSPDFGKGMVIIMKKHSLTNREITYMISHSVCFIAVLFFYINNYTFICLIFLLLLSLHVPLLICSHRSEPLTPYAPDDEVLEEALEPVDNPPADKQTVIELPKANEPSAILTSSCQMESILPEYTNVSLSMLDLIEYSTELLKEFTARYGVKKNQAEVQCEMNHINLLVHKELLKIAFCNLFDNALKYVKADETGASRLILTISQNSSDVLIIFRNNKSGVTPSDIPFLTERNYQASNCICGTGLGLFQTKAAVESMQGTMWIKSSPNTGFAVYLRLPRKMPDIGYVSDAE